ncbi:MAG: hypothetical protein COV59_03690 [Candidatus Magasanikbacteria bacterium CG11_big_fil_rev_8_21_14_0_20_39_34]|uniref:Bacterial sugar transferase domain-containing protein n=1 Tax=Candidatus Magasanikbacteria bacterium CG11_big_fil_rev_8_21_14_0_20_39_34 TaxID=1974653 RepID=A0A2H0N5V6_9BACT|nr:MAG: hypothetical protein COV59_03690 [Candidatus Magasanikbacteria bacterium CG11_big_fil_rev_8_21_14_0_20_39_34]
MNLMYRSKQILLILGDLLIFVFSLWLSISVRHFSVPSSDTFFLHLHYFFFILLTSVVINYINGLYDLDDDLRGKRLLRRILETSSVSLVATIAYFYVIDTSEITPKTLLLLNIFFAYSLIFFWRNLFRHIARFERLTNNIVFVGLPKETEELIQHIETKEGKGYKVVAIINEIKEKDKSYPCEVYTDITKIRAIITTKKAHTIVVAPHLKNTLDINRELYELLFWDVRVVDLSSFYENMMGRVPPFTFSESWFLQNLGHKDNPIYLRIRKALDYITGILLFGIFLLLLPVVAVLIKLDSKGPVFFSQNRIGKFGNTFRIFKFRSMFALSEDGSAEVDGAQFAIKNDKRVTRIGRFLRKTRIDELPQCINILKGELTLVGPRPERPQIVEKLELQMPYYSLRHIVKPGITGWAVIHQNYTDNLETSLQKLQYDLYYIKNRSILLDLSILLRTVNVIMRFRGQ